MYGGKYFGLQCYLILYIVFSLAGRSITQPSWVAFYFRGFLGKAYSISFHSDALLRFCRLLLISGIIYVIGPKWSKEGCTNHSPVGWCIKDGDGHLCKMIYGNWISQTKPLPRYPNSNFTGKLKWSAGKTGSISLRSWKRWEKPIGNWWFWRDFSSSLLQFYCKQWLYHSLFDTWYGLSLREKWSLGKDISWQFHCFWYLLDFRYFLPSFIILARWSRWGWDPPSSGVFIVRYG